MFSDMVVVSTTTQPKLRKAIMQTPTQVQIQQELQKSLLKDYRRLRRQVMQKGMKSLDRLERKFYMEYPRN